jgi:MSHA pilin protein MshC
MLIRQKVSIFTKGFTLVEVVTVLVLIGILATVVVAKYTGTQGYEAYNYRTRLISALRLTQQRAMQQTNATFCHQLVIESKRFGIPDRTNCAVTTFPANWQPDATGDQVESRYTVNFSVVNKSLPALIGFDDIGRPLSSCSGGCIINIAENSQTVQIQIESEGFVHAL